MFRVNYTTNQNFISFVQEKPKKQWGGYKMLTF